MSRVCFNVCCVEGCLYVRQCSQWRAVSLWGTGFICFYVVLWTACLLISLFLWSVQGLQEKCSYLAAAYSNIDKWALMLSSRILREFGTVWAQQFFAAFVSFCQAEKKRDSKTVEKLDNWLTWKCIAWSNLFLSEKEREMFLVPRHRSLFLHDQHIFLFYPHMRLFYVWLLACGKSLGLKLYQI